MILSLIFVLGLSASYAAEENSVKFCQIMERASLALSEKDTVKHNSQNVDKISNYAHLLKSVAPKCNEVQVKNGAQGVEIHYKDGFAVDKDIFNFQKNGKVLSWERTDKDGIAQTINF